MKVIVALTQGGSSLNLVLGLLRLGFGGIVAAATKAAAAREQASAPPNSGAEEKPPAINRSKRFYLVRSALLTLNDANRCGNYTVLRDLAAPDFQARNTAADLARIFA